MFDVGRALLTANFLAFTAFAAAAVISEDAKLTANDAAAQDQFGYSVAVDGNNAVIGAYLDDDFGFNSGSAYVFARDVAGNWTQQAKLTASDAATIERFGVSTGIAGDTIVIGADGDDDFGDGSGSAYVFARDGANNWTQQAKLTASDAAANDRFGSSSAIAGETIVIGAIRDDDNGKDSGSAYVFTRDGAGNWSEQAKLTASDAAASGLFGNSAAIADDTIVIGAEQHKDIGVASGSAYVFTRDGAGNWSEQAKLTASDGAASDRFGSAVAIGRNTAVIGARFAGHSRGSAYVFTRDQAGSWTEQAKLTASDRATNDRFGSSTAIAGDTIIVGASRKAYDGRFNIGLAYVFTRDGTGHWTEQAKVRPSDAASVTKFGQSVSLSGDTAVIGASDNIFNGAGSAYVFTVPRFFDFDVVRSGGDINGNGNTDMIFLYRDPRGARNKIIVYDGADGLPHSTVLIGGGIASGYVTMPDVTGDSVAEVAVLIEGSLYARVHDPVTPTRLNRVPFNSNFDTVAFLSVGDAGGEAGPELAVVGLDSTTGKAQAKVKNSMSDGLLNRFVFDKDFVPFGAVVVDNVGDSAANEIAVLGINAAGQAKAEVRDAQSGNQINVIDFGSLPTPQAFIALPDASGDRTLLAVLRINVNGLHRATIRRVSDGALVSKVSFSQRFDPRAFLGFADSNGSGGGEIVVVGVDDNGQVRAEAREIVDGALVRKINFSSNYPPVEASAVNGVAGTGRNEIAVLGRSKGQYRIQIKDLLTGDNVSTFFVP